MILLKLFIEFFKTGLLRLGAGLPRCRFYTAWRTVFTGLPTQIL